MHHYDDDVNLIYHCNMFISLFSVSGFSSFKEYVFQGTPFKKTILGKLNYVQCLNIFPIEKAWFMAPMEKVF